MYRENVDDMITIKARLVARGFEEDNATFRKDSPTWSKRELEISSHNFCIKTLEYQ